MLDKLLRLYRRHRHQQ